MKKKARESTGEKIVLSLMALLFLLFGPGLIYAGYLCIAEAAKEPSLADLNRDRAYVATWPSVTGELDRVDLKQVTLHGKYSGPNYCYPKVEYHYNVGNQQYKGNCLKRIDVDSDDSYTGYNSAGFTAKEHKDDLEHCKANMAAFLKPEDKAKETRIGTEDYLYTFFPHRPVTVYYDPKKPELSMLDNRLGDAKWSDYQGNLAFGATFLILVGVLGCWPHIFIVLKAFGLGPFSKEKSEIKHVGDSAIKPIPIEQQWQVESNLHINTKEDVEQLEP